MILNKNHIVGRVTVHNVHVLLLLLLSDLVPRYLLPLPPSPSIALSTSLRFFLLLMSFYFWHLPQLSIISLSPN